METLKSDLRHAVRMFLKNPGFGAAAILCLTLGIGATTGIFSVVDAVLLRPLGYQQPDRLVRIYTEFPTLPLLLIPGFNQRQDNLLGLRSLFIDNKCPQCQSNHGTTDCWWSSRKHIGLESLF